MAYFEALSTAGSLLLSCCSIRSPTHGVTAAQGLVDTVNQITQDNDDGATCAQIMIEIKQVCVSSLATWLQTR